MSYAREQRGDAAAPRMGGGLRQSKPSKPVDGYLDVEELTRRLTIVLKDQEARTQRRAWKERHSRIPGAKSQESAGVSSRHRHKRDVEETVSSDSKASLPSTAIRKSSQPVLRSNKVLTETTATTGGANPTEYHHVPREAAKQFARTTTVDKMRNNRFIHQLSRRTLKSHTENPAEVARALRHGQARRDKALKSPTNIDKQHTFEGELARLNSNHNRASITGHAPGARRNSTGNPAGTAGVVSTDSAYTHHPNEPTTRRSMLILDTMVNSQIPVAEEVEDITPEDEQIIRHHAHIEPRVDWTQSDESKVPGQVSRSQSSKLLLSPLLRRADTIFALKGRSKNQAAAAVSTLSSPTSPGTGSSGPTRAQTSQDNVGVLPVPVKSPKGGFFSKFKR